MKKIVQISSLCAADCAMCKHRATMTMTKFTAGVAVEEKGNRK